MVIATNSSFHFSCPWCRLDSTGQLIESKLIPCVKDQVVKIQLAEVVNIERLAFYCVHKVYIQSMKIRPIWGGGQCKEVVNYGGFTIIG